MACAALALTLQCRDPKPWIRKSVSDACNSWVGKVVNASEVFQQEFDLTLPGRHRVTAIDFSIGSRSTVYIQMLSLDSKRLLGIWHYEAVDVESQAQLTRVATALNLPMPKD